MSFGSQEIVIAWGDGGGCVQEVDVVRKVERVYYAPFAPSPTHKGQPQLKPSHSTKQPIAMATSRPLAIIQGPTWKQLKITRWPFADSDITVVVGTRKTSGRGQLFSFSLNWGCWG